MLEGVDSVCTDRRALLLVVQRLLGEIWEEATAEERAGIFRHVRRVERRVWGRGDGYPDSACARMQVSGAR